MITSARYFFVGAHVTEATKKALREEATRRGWSVSQLIAFALVKFLQRRRYKINDDGTSSATDQQS
jgi:hypothetical protein